MHATPRSTSYLFCMFLTVLLTSVDSRGDQASGSGDTPGVLLSIQAIAVRGDTVYIGSFGRGVYRSDDRGASWKEANRGLNDPFILTLAIASDGTIYAGTFRGGVFHSRNGGQSWEAVNEGLKRLEIKALLVQGKQVYSGTADGVYQLSRDGKTWHVVTKGLEDILVHTIIVHPDGTMFVGTSAKGVLRYKAHRKKDHEWQRVEKMTDHEGRKDNFIRIMTLDRKSNLLAGTFDSGVFRSPDGGKTWTPISRALPNDSIRGIVVNPKGVFVGTGRGVYQSDDDGGKWKSVNNGLTELSIQVLIGTPEGMLYAGTGSGAFRSDDDGKSWRSLSEGLLGSNESPFQHFFPK